MHDEIHYLACKGHKYANTVVAIICFCLIAEKTSQYTKYSVGDSKYFGVNEITGEIFVAGILFGQANQVSSL